jgi:hypothetical protein
MDIQDVQDKKKPIRPKRISGGEKRKSAPCPKALFPLGENCERIGKA